jgi:acetylornithine deacetylase/succinyl-diaminopimelate desuccinylase-like protein
VVDHVPVDAERATYAKLAMVSQSSGYNAQKTSMDHPLARRVAAAVQRTTADKIVRTPTLGGSLPLYMFETILNAQPITVPIANHDNNQHAENENLRLRNFWTGIESFISIMLLPK